MAEKNLRKTDPRRKNVWLKRSIQMEFDALLGRLNTEGESEGAEFELSDLVNGALVLFFEQETEAQLDLIERGRSPDVQKLRLKLAGKSEAEAQRVMDSATGEAPMQDAVGEPPQKRLKQK